MGKPNRAMASEPYLNKRKESRGAEAAPQYGQRMAAPIKRPQLLQLASLGLSPVVEDGRASLSFGLSSGSSEIWLGSRFFLRQTVPDSVLDVT